VARFRPRRARGREYQRRERRFGLTSAQVRGARPGPETP
jgi:hypothetical protein